MAKDKRLYKTTIIIWSEYHPDIEADLEVLARAATNGDAYCSAQKIELIADPEQDPDWDGTAFFDE